MPSFRPPSIRRFVGPSLHSSVSRPDRLRLIRPPCLPVWPAYAVLASLSLAHVAHLSHLANFGSVSSFGSFWLVWPVFFFQFHECWWDSLIIDLLGANLIGMTLGLYTLRFLETRTFDWNSKERSTKFARSLVSHQPPSGTQSGWHTSVTVRLCPRRSPVSWAWHAPHRCHARHAPRRRHLCEGVSSGRFAEITLTPLRHDLQRVH